jgi:hypothetical protein
MLGFHAAVPVLGAVLLPLEKRTGKPKSRFRSKSTFRHLPLRDTPCGEMSGPGSGSLKRPIPSASS